MKMMEMAIRQKQQKEAQLDAFKRRFYELNCREPLPEEIAENMRDGGSEENV